MARRRAQPYLLEACGRVLTYRDDTVPDLFVHIKPIKQGSGRGVAVFLNATTWDVLHSGPGAMGAYLDEVVHHRGGYALTNPTIMKVAADQGIRRRLRSA